jgi:hypothetical protein
MERFLIVFRGSTAGEAEGPQHQPARWQAWFDGISAAVVDRGGFSQGSVEVPNRLLGAKTSGSPCPAIVWSVPAISTRPCAWPRLHPFSTRTVPSKSRT